jgi:N-acetylneuraminate synthase/N,N'-diacetyllegionaminate synthase
MKHTIIIAEAGVNHNGDIELAKKLIEVAADAGADYVKFQTFKADKIVSKDAKKAEYQINNLGGNDDSQYGMLKKLELSENDHHILHDYAINKGIKFASTGFDEESIDYLEKFNPDFIKIPSGEITNKPYLQHIAQKGRPVILSTGMANLDEIKQALSVLNKVGLSNDKITVLHCNTEYPTPMKDVNLFAMVNMAKALNVHTGYSDHTLGIEVPIAAVALGARVIEKHFTLGRNLTGPDHLASLEPKELKQMISGIRNIELAISGSGIKEPSESEKKNIPLGRRSIHVKNDLPAGHIIEISDLIMLRPGNGLSPMEIEKVVGKKTILALAKNALLDYSNLEDGN